MKFFINQILMRISTFISRSIGKIMHDNSCPNSIAIISWSHIFRAARVLCRIFHRDDYRHYAFVCVCMSSKHHLFCHILQWWDKEMLDLYRGMLNTVKCFMDTLLQKWWLVYISVHTAKQHMFTRDLILNNSWILCASRKLNAAKIKFLYNIHSI